MRVAEPPNQQSSSTRTDAADSHFERLYRENYTALLALAEKWGVNEDQAHELVQEAFARAYHRLHLLDAQTSARTFLLTVLRRLVLNRRRSQHDELGETEREGVDTLSAVRDALADLTERDREILFMRYVEGKTLSDIAVAMDLTFSAVASRVIKATQRLRRKLEVAADE